VPYFKWLGIDLQGKLRKGMTFARSDEHLDNLLLRRDIALTSSRITRPLIVLPMSLEAKIRFFERLATLLNAGIHLPQALSILAESFEFPAAQEMILDIESRVKGGQSLHDSLAAYPHLFSPMMIHMVNVGAEAGALPLSLNILAMHLKTKHQFYKKVRSAALLPVLTFLFFISIALVIFIVIMPLFSSMFESIGKEMPTITMWMMRVSNFLSSSKAVFFGLGIAVLAILIYRWIGKERRKTIVDRMVLKMPGISHLVVMSSSFSFFQSVAILLEGGMQLVPALKIGNETINNHILRAELKPLIRSVASGCSLSQALAAHNGPFSVPDIEAMITVGQESGQLPVVLTRVAHDYKERTERMLSFYSTLFQPLIMILLGLFIALLIVAVYIPILTLSSAIS